MPAFAKFRSVTAILFGCFAIQSCGADELLPCDEDAALLGLLCREYRYENETPVGFVDFVYNKDSIVEQYLYDAQTILRKTVIERYEGGQLQTVAERYQNGLNIVSSYHYLSNDSLECIIFGAADSSTCFTYVNGKRFKEEAYHGPDMVRYSEYRYYPQDGRLFRISRFDGNDSLLSYLDYDYFFGGIIRVDHYLGDHTFIGYEVTDMDVAGNVLSVQYADSSGAARWRLDNTYDADGRLTETNEIFPFGSHRSVFIYH